MTDEQEWATSSVVRDVLPEPLLPTKAQVAECGMKILCAVPMERTIQQEAFFGFIQLAVQGWAFCELPYTRNDIARYRFAQHLLESDYTHLLMMDSDHRHPKDIVQRLARWCIVYPQVEVVGALCFRRGEPYDPCAFIWDNGHYRRLAVWAEGCFAVDALGTGAMLIDRKVFERLTPPYFEYHYEDLEGFPGTDMTFARHCKEAGILQWVDTTTVSPHIGTNMIDGATYKRYLTEHGAVVE